MLEGGPFSEAERRALIVQAKKNGCCISHANLVKEEGKGTGFVLKIWDFMPAEDDGKFAL